MTEIQFIPKATFLRKKEFLVNCIQLLEENMHYIIFCILIILI